MFGVHIWRFEYFGAKLNGVGEGAMIVNSPILFITFFVYMDAHFFIIPWFIKNTYGYADLQVVNKKRTNN